MKCSICHTHNPAQARFCMGCGAKLVQGQVCCSCYTLLPLHAQYCFHCGSFMGQTGPYTPPPVISYPAAAVYSPPVVNTPDAVAVTPAAADGGMGGGGGDGGGKGGGGRGGSRTAPTVAATADPLHPALPAPRPLAEMLPSLQRFLPAELYEPLERRPKERDLLAVRDHLSALIHTCKTYLARPVILSPQPPGVPAGGMQRGVFLFGDVSGFTALSEKLKVLGQAGAEQITSIINALFTELVKVLFAHGGTLLKFGGDAMLGMWEVENDTEMAAAALYACQTAQAIQAVLKQPQFAEIDALGEKHALLIKVGISAGPFFAAHVGTAPSEYDPNGTMVFITTGETVNLAEEAEEHANPGQVSMTLAVANWVTGRVEVGPVEREPDEGYRRLISAPILEGSLQSSLEVHEPPEGALDAQLTYLVQRMDRLSPYMSDELVSRIVENPQDACINPEHRPVTVMFVNYKGISKLIEKHGDSEPELITTHLNNYFVKMASIVERYEGTLARMDQYAVGDRIVIFFGAPRAHEDDPVRAIYTALEMQETVKNEFGALRTSSGIFRFEQRVGVNTGHLFAGNAGAPDLRQEYTLMGDDINMAARLMSNAPWGDIYLSRRTRDHVAAYIDLEFRGDLKVKGKQILIPTFAAKARRGEEGRTRGFDSGESPLTGRDGQLKILQQRAQAFLKGRGQIFAIMGHSGLGKSRLTRELRAWLLAQPESARQESGGAQWVEARALSFSEQTGYWMASQMMRSLLQVTSVTRQDDVLYKLSERAEELLGEQAMDAVPYLAHMMGLDLGEEWAWVKKEDPKVRQKQTFWAAAEFIEAAAKQHPLIIALDDLHWADEASLTLFGHLLKVTDQAPVLFCLLFRPLREQGCWRLRDLASSQYPHRLFELPLDPLDATASNLLLDRLLPGAVFPAERRDDILSKAAGNPFYLEEMVRSLMEAEAVIPNPAQAGCWQVTDRITQIAVPVNLHAAIAARIDRLTEDARQALQVASVIGRQFRLELLRNMTNATAEIDLWLAQLERGGLVSTSDQELQDLLYSFPDALVHEVAYDSLLVLKRQQLHHQVGDLLESVFGDALEANSGILAYHYGHSDESDKALKYLQMAAKKSEEQYANATAIEYYKKILQIRRVQGDRAGQAVALYAMGVKAYELGSFDSARAWLAEAADLQRKVEDRKSEAWSVMYLGMIDLKQGDYPGALEHHQDALNNARQRCDSFQEGIHLTNLARVNMRLGQYDLAMQQFGQSLTLKKSNNDITGQAFALFYLGLTSLYIGQDVDAECYLNDSLVMWQQVNFNERGLAYVEQGMGLLALAREQYAQAEECLRSAVQRCEKLVLKAELIENLSHLSQAVLGQHNLESARQLTDQAMQLLERQKDVEEEQSIYFNHYRVLAAQGDAQAVQYKELAATTVAQQAERIADEKLKADFLARVRVNQAIAG